MVRQTSTVAGTRSHAGAAANGPDPAPAGLRARAEQHPVATIALVALVVRVVVAGVLQVRFGGALFGDDATYTDLAAEMAAGQTSDWDGFTRVLYWQTATFLVPLTLVFRLFGPVPMAGQILAALFGIAAAAFTTRLAVEVVGARWAMFAGAVAAFFPSQVLWSTLPLKDSAVWAVTSALALALALGARVRGWRRIAAFAAAGTLLFLLGHLRWHTTVVVAWAVAIASWAGPAEGRLRRGLAGVALAVVVPWQLGLGPFGVTLVTNAGSLAQRRAINAQHAETAFVPPPPPDRPKPANPTRDEGSDAAGRARAEVEEDQATASGADLSHLPRGLSVMLLEPYPWQWSANLRVRLAMAENVVWYPLLALGAVGAWRARRRLDVLSLPLLYAGAITVTYALVEGNFGTAYRHRGEVVWVVAVLAAAGARAVVERRRAGAHMANDVGFPPANGGGATIRRTEASTTPEIASK